MYNAKSINMRAIRNLNADFDTDEKSGIKVYKHPLVGELNLKM